MAEYSTPKAAGELSSVFMTPSSSAGRPLYQKPKLLTPIPHLSFLSPASTPGMSKSAAHGHTDTEHKDVLTELYSCGIPHLVNQILTMLSPADLYSCLQVSHKWHDIITEKPYYLEQIKSHLKASTENAKKLHTPLNSTSTTRRALCTISNHLPVRPQTFPLHKPAYKAERTQKHRPCPTCGSPARELNLRRTICTNLACQMDFCQMCFRRWHEGECAEGRGSRSPKRTQSTLIAGSLKSKKRLRRL